MVRRMVAGAAIVVVIIVLAIGIHSCQVSSQDSALRAYSTNVNSLIAKSDGTGASVFGVLTGAGNGDELTLDTQLNNLRTDAQSELTTGENLSAPGAVSKAQQALVLALSLRRDGIADIADNFEASVSKTPQTAIGHIAADMQRFLASDVIYTTQTATGIAAALHGAGIAVGGTNGVTIQPTDFIHDVAWLEPTYVASKIGGSAAGASSSGSSCPSGDSCGHELNSVTVGSVELSPAGGTTVSANPAPTFTVNFTNSGHVAESNVSVKISVTDSSGATITASKVEAVTQPGQAYNLQITLPKAPATGSGNVTVTVAKVPGETDIANNTQTYPVTFA